MNDRLEVKKVAVVILNWNGKHLLEQFIPVLLKNTPEHLANFIVADNASTDGSIPFLRKNYPFITSIRMETNHGFATAYNIVLTGMRNEYAVLLNSDVEVTEGWLEPLVEYLDEHPEVSAAQPKILSYKNKDTFEYAGAAGGYIDYLGYPFCRGRMFDSIEKDRGQYNDIRPIFWASGACMFIRPQSFREAGGFEDLFFAHQEEIDLCWRMNAQGKQIVFIPSSVVYHIGGATLQTESYQKTFLNFRNNLLLLYTNVPDKDLKKILFIRYFMDLSAALLFFIQGHSANAKAVLNARKAFREMKASFKPLRERAQSRVIVENPPLIYRKSIVLRYYWDKVREFSGLGWEN